MVRSESILCTQDANAQRVAVRSIAWLGLGRRMVTPKECIRFFSMLPIARDVSKEWVALGCIGRSPSIEQQAHRLQMAGKNRGE